MCSPRNDISCHMHGAEPMLGAVETGRYRTPKVPLGERVCKCCNNDKVETEFYFVMECSKLQNPEMRCSLL